MVSNDRDYWISTSDWVICQEQDGLTIAWYLNRASGCTLRWKLFYVVAFESSQPMKPDTYPAGFRRNCPRLLDKCTNRFRCEPIRPWPHNHIQDNGI
ncbi:hypothetical protein D3C81_1113740 [compost metagenome]